MVARSPISQHATAPGGDASLRGRDRLPSDRPVTVSVVRLSFTGLLTIGVAFGLLCFVGGVLAGTSGAYREVASWSTKWVDDENWIRRLALWPDRTAGETPLLGERLDVLAKTVGDGMAASMASSREIADRYRLQEQGLLKFRSQIDKAAHQSNQAADYCFWARRQVELLQALLQEGIEVCQAETTTSVLDDPRKSPER